MTERSTNTNAESVLLTRDRRGLTGRYTVRPITTMVATAHHRYEQPTSWRHQAASVSWCSVIRSIGVHIISARPAAVTNVSATLRRRYATTAVAMTAGNAHTQ